MRRSKIVTLRKLQGEWHVMKERNKSKTDPELMFVVEWVNDLRKTLYKHRNDLEFVTDVIATAAAFYNESMNDREKTDAFVFLLGKIVNY